MFIRETKKKVNKKTYKQCQLIESVRTKIGPRQKLVLNMGNINLEKEKWKTLANAIEAKLKKQKKLFPDEPQIEKLASHYATLIVQNQLNKESLSKKEERGERDEAEKNKPKREITKNNKEENQREEKEKKYANVDINSLTHSQARSIGAEYATLSQLEKYQVDKILSDLGFTEKQRHYAKILITARAVNPSSELETARWANEDSSIKELLGTKISIYDNGLHRAAKLLWKNKDVLEEKIANLTKERFSLKENIILYDLTNTFFEGSMRESKIAKPGKSKERRNDRPLVTLALRVDEHGFPKKSEIYEGNISEPKTLSDVLEDLSEKKGLLREEKTVVIDAGIATEENIKEISRHGFKYLVVSRKRTYQEDFWKQSIEKEISTRDKKKKLKVRLKKTEKELFLLCHSQDKELKEAAILEKKLEKFEEALSNLDKGLKKKRTKKQYAFIVEKIGRLKQQYGVGNLYEIEIQTKEKGNKENKKDKDKDKARSKNKNKESRITKGRQLVRKITFKKNMKKIKEKNIGRYVIRTNRFDLNEEEISLLHRSLTRVESSFRSMKSELGLRPNYHKNDLHIKAHIFITVLAYNMIASILRNLSNKNIHQSWSTVSKTLSSHTRVTSSFDTKEGKVMHIRGNTTANLKQVEIYNALGIKHNPLGSKSIEMISDKLKSKNM